ncbi:hypothetical protein [Halogranum rubrum]|nr:hypothetical protein [Halogranum salarium]
MRRRALLSTLGVTVLAGCTANDSVGNTGDRTASSTDSLEPATAPATATPDATDVGVSPAEAAGPPWDDDVKRVVSWADVTESTPIALRPPTQQASLPGATFEFTLANDTDVRFETNFYGWSVWKQVDEAWFHVAPTAWPVPLMTLESGESHTWTVTVDNSELHRDIMWVEGTEDLSLAGLGGGTYAFTIDGWFASQDYDQSLGFASQFVLDGDPVELVPTNEVTGTTREGDTVVVETSHGAGDDSRRAAFVVERLGDESVESQESDVRRLITEQALRDRELRNTLPFFEEGVETVRLEEQNSSWPIFGLDEPRVIEYEGVQYRLSAEELSASAAQTDQ